MPSKHALALFLVNNIRISPGECRKSTPVENDQPAKIAIINTHVHEAYLRFNLKNWIQNGITTVRDLGGDMTQNLFHFRDEANTDNQTGLNCHHRMRTSRHR